MPLWCNEPKRHLSAGVVVPTFLILAHKAYSHTKSLNTRAELNYKIDYNLKWFQLNKNIKIIINQYKNKLL